MNFSIVPPWRSTSSVMARKNACRTPRSSSGSRCVAELGRRREVREHYRHDPTLLQVLGRCGRRRDQWRGLGRRVERQSTRAAEPGRHMGGRPAGRAVSPESRPTGATEPLTRRIRRPTARARAVRRQSLLDPVAHDTPATRRQPRGDLAARLALPQQALPDRPAWSDASMSRRLGPARRRRHRREPAPRRRATKEVTV